MRNFCFRVTFFAVLTLAFGSLAAPPDVRRFVSRPEFVAALEGHFGPTSRTVTVARAALSKLGADGRMVVVTAPFGVFAGISSDEARAVILFRADGGIYCYSDSGCPPGADDVDSSPAGEQPGYQAQEDMGAPSLLGQGELVIVPLGREDSVGLVLGRSPADSYPESYQIVRVTRDKIRMERPLVRAVRFEDVDGDGKIDAIERSDGGPGVAPDATWVRVLFGDGKGRFASNARRAKTFMELELNRHLTALEGPPVVEDPDSASAFSLAGPIVAAYGAAAAGKLLSTRLGRVALSRVQALPKALGLKGDHDDERIARLHALLRCLDRGAPTERKVAICTSRVEGSED